MFDKKLDCVLGVVVVPWHSIVIQESSPCHIRRVNESGLAWMLGMGMMRFSSDHFV
jgi:hypothetical protein